jgi:tRNA (cytidine32/uridine32-2'-O)-methyltransferase
MDYASLLDNVSIVLVDTKTPANIGATARCMMNMGLSHLILVRPPKDPSHDAVKLAVGADIILDMMQTFSTLKEAVAGHGLVLGTSRQKGRLRANISTPHDAACAIIPLLPQSRAAIVFGNEVNGLERKDLALCHEFISIPSSDAFPSLNISHAVMIVAYELFLASNGPFAAVDHELARSEAIEGFYQHLEKTLIDIEFLDRNEPKRMMFTLRQMFGRSRLNQRDVAVLRGILSAVERAARL